MTNAGKASVWSTQRSSQKVEAAVKAQQIGYKVKARMGESMQRTILNEKQLEPSSAQI